MYSRSSIEERFSYQEKAVSASLTGNIRQANFSREISLVL